MNKIKAIIAIIIALILVRGGEVQAKTMDYSVNPILPENQVKKGVSYFDLLLEPDKQQTLEVELENLTEKKQTIKVLISSAVTNASGVVDYSPTNLPLDASLKYNIKDYTQAPKVVNLAAHERQVVKIKVKMPRTPFDGVIAGGITFQQEGQTEADNQAAAKGISVKNTYSYSIALLIRQNEKELPAQLKLHTIKAGQVNGRNVINVNLQNPEMAYLNTVNVEATVRGLTHKEVAYTYSNPMLQMAPNTNFNLPIPTSNQNAATRVSEPLQAGKYELEMIVSARTDPKGAYEAARNGKKENYRYQWTFKKTFTIAQGESDKLNKSDPTIKTTHKSWMWQGILLGLIFLMAAVLLLLIKKRRQTKAQEIENQKLREKLAKQAQTIEELNAQKKEK